MYTVVVGRHVIIKNITYLSRIMFEIKQILYAAITAYRTLLRIITDNGR
jgi:hypothetical protein